MMNFKKVFVVLMLTTMLAALASCSSGSSSSYSTRESRYDAKYGQGEYKKDVELYNTMKNAWPGN